MATQTRQAGARKRPGRTGGVAVSDLSSRARVAPRTKSQALPEARPASGSQSPEYIYHPLPTLRPAPAASSALSPNSSTHREAVIC
jgi:hypothetical protein